MKISEIAELVGGDLLGSGDAEIFSVAAIDSAGHGQLSFYEMKGELPATGASCVIVSRSTLSEAETLPEPRVTLIVSKNPKLAFAVAASAIHPPKGRKSARHTSAVISASAVLDDNIFIGAFVVVGDRSTIGRGTHLGPGATIGDNVTIGENCIIHPNVSIYDGCTIGSGVVLHAGVVIGADGFGYVRNDEPAAFATESDLSPSGSGAKYIKFPQIGTVVIEDDVEIGANTCIDRGALGKTSVGAGTKIDNLVQIGHNVDIGKRCVIAAQTGISGSVVIEDDCVIGGQVGFGDHATVRSGAVIGSQAGVLPGKIVRPGVWWGTPVQPLDEYKRQNAHIKALGRLRQDVKELKKTKNSE